MCIKRVLIGFMQIEVMPICYLMAVCGFMGITLKAEGQERYGKIQMTNMTLKSGIIPKSPYGRGNNNI